VSALRVPTSRDPCLSLRTRLAAPVAAVLAASLDLDVELAAVRRYGVRTRAGRPGRAGRARRPGAVTAGPIGLGETVTWQLRPVGTVGLPLHTSRIVELVEDDGSGAARFVDAMEHGLFRAFRHEHLLRPEPSGGEPVTVMDDHVRWRSPLGPLGRTADAVFVRRALLALLRARNAEIGRRVAAG
jgi:ligand-binding SRPBCC domain-containing protein